MSAQASRNDRSMDLRSSYKDHSRAVKKLRRAVANFCRAMEEFYGLQGRFRLYITDNHSDPVVAGCADEGATVH